MTSSCVVVIMVLMVTLSLVSFSSATIYAVGDMLGWAPGVDYATWAAGKTFKVGDSLVFSYDASLNVEQVSLTDYQACSADNPLASYSSSPTIITLNTTGSHFFVCGIPQYCYAGMKLGVYVGASDNSLNPHKATRTSNIPLESS